MAGEGAQHKSIISGFSPKTICDWEIGQRSNPGSQAGLGPWRWLLNWNCRGTRWHNFLFSPARYGCMADRDWDGKAADKLRISPLSALETQKNARQQHTRTSRFAFYTVSLGFQPVLGQKSPAIYRARSDTSFPCENSKWIHWESFGKFDLSRESELGGERRRASFRRSNYQPLTLLWFPVFETTKRLFK